MFRARRVRRGAALRQKYLGSLTPEQRVAEQQRRKQAERGRQEAARRAQEAYEWQLHGHAINTTVRDVADTVGRGDHATWVGALAAGVGVVGAAAMAKVFSLDPAAMAEVVFHEPQKLILPGLGTTLGGAGVVSGLRIRKQGFTRASELLVHHNFLPVPAGVKDRQNYFGRVSEQLIGLYDYRKGLDRAVRRRGDATPEQGKTSVQRTLSNIKPYGNRSVSL